MGLAWQQGPLAAGAIGHFRPPNRSPSGCCSSSRCAGGCGSSSAGNGSPTASRVLLHEPGHYPVAYFPMSAVTAGALEPGEHTTATGPRRDILVHGALGRDRSTPRAAWQHT